MVSGGVVLPWKYDHLLSWDYKGCAQLAVVDGVAGRVRMLGGIWWWWCGSRGLGAESALQRNPSVHFVKSWWAEIPQPASCWLPPLGIRTDCGCTYTTIKYWESTKTRVHSTNHPNSTCHFTGHVFFFLICFIFFSSLTMWHQNLEFFLNSRWQHGTEIGFHPFLFGYSLLFHPEQGAWEYTKMTRIILFVFSYGGNGFSFVCSS